MGPVAHRGRPRSRVIQMSRRNGTARPLAMSDNGSNFYWGREELLGLLSNSATLAGLCVTVVALMSTFDKTEVAVSFVDDLFALCATAFLLCTYVIFWALRSSKGAIPIRWGQGDRRALSVGADVDDGRLFSHDLHNLVVAR